MKILDVLNSPWAIVPDKLFEITEIYSRHLRGEKIDVAAIEAQIGKPLQHQPKGYQIADGGVAVLPVEGVLAKRMNMMMQFSGGTSMQHMTRDLRAALDDPQVNSVILAVDSPGGTVDGTLDVGRAVMDARGSDKPVVAWVDGLMASAAYWIGSAADSIFINSGTDMVGSIGVAMQHVDYSGADAQRGIKRTDIYSGAYKRIASDAGPLTPDGRAYLQAQSDYYYSLFVEHVAQQRGVSVDKVLSDMADGRIFIGQQAIDAGLVDGASTLDALIAELANGTYQRRRAPRNATGAVAVAGVILPDAVHVTSNSTGAGDAPTIKPSIYEDHMDIATLKEKHPDVAKALVDEGFAAGATQQCDAH
jgi:signal peptide peptidase SppA